MYFTNEFLLTRQDIRDTNSLIPKGKVSLYSPSALCSVLSIYTQYYFENNLVELCLDYKWDVIYIILSFMED